MPPPPVKPKEFKLLRIPSDPLDFERQVNAQLAIGWDLHGPTHVGRTDEGTVFMQAFTRDKPPTKPALVDSPDDTL